MRVSISQTQGNFLENTPVLSLFTPMISHVLCTDDRSLGKLTIGGEECDRCTIRTSATSSTNTVNIVF